MFRGEEVSTRNRAGSSQGKRYSSNVRTGVCRGTGCAGRPVPARRGLSGRRSQPLPPAEQLHHPQTVSPPPQDRRPLPIDPVARRGHLPVAPTRQPTTAPRSAGGRRPGRPRASAALRRPRAGQHRFAASADRRCRPPGVTGFGGVCAGGGPTQI